MCGIFGKLAELFGKSGVTLPSRTVVLGKTSGNLPKTAADSGKTGRN
jgi:hypothetical protein